MTKNLSPHLKRLEAEAIEIMREVAAEFRKPVMLYSIGKDSSVMLHVALKAFYPGKLPFPLLHVDTTWKFREMIEFRDRRVRELGVDLLVHINREGRARGINPIASGSSLQKCLKVNVYLNDLKDYDRMNVVYRSYDWGAVPPVRTTVAPASGIPGNSLIEIDVIAYI